MLKSTINGALLSLFLCSGIQGGNFNSSFAQLLEPNSQSISSLVSTTSSLLFPIPAHTLYTIADNDRSIGMEDGSYWNIASGDAYLVRSWRPGDLLSILPDYSWFSNYDYYIVNKSDGTQVRANLYIGPVAFGSYANWVVDIDNTGHVYLQNGMIWCVHPKDAHALRHWAINDHIILGQEDSAWSYYDHILINVNTDEFVRAKQYAY